MAPRMDDFVSKIVTDPKNPPNTLLLKGFIGASSEEGHIRLYLDSELSDYIEIPETAILHSQDIPREKSPIGGSYVWIQRDATMIHGPAVAERPKASFLQGRIMTTQACAAGPLPQTVSGPACGTIVDGCTDVGPKCPTQVTCPAPCPTKTGTTCPASSCTHVGPNCITLAGANTCPAPSCTQNGPNCPTTPGATCSGPACPTTVSTTCSGPNCPTTPEATCCGPRCPTFPANTCGGPQCHTVTGNTCPATSCTHIGPACPTVQGTTCPATSCTHIGPGCPTSQGTTCPSTTCTHTGPLCVTKTDPNCFPTEAGKTCAPPCHVP
jgi:hypothetical protein